jgi:hypothetical protein
MRDPRLSLIEQARNTARAYPPGTYVGQLAQAVVDQHAEIDALKRLLSELVDPDPCWFDHNGGCQAHGFISLQPGKTCPHADVKALLGVTR